MDFTIPKPLEELRDRVSAFVREKIIPFEKDPRWGHHGIPEDLRRDLNNAAKEAGLLGINSPEEFGGKGFSQLANCKVMEIIGGHCSSTAVFVNAHHSIGIRALLLFGTEAQKKRWLPGLVSGQELAAFALTEPEAGSDAANVQTTATPTPDGTGYVLKLMGKAPHPGQTGPEAGPDYPLRTAGITPAPSVDPARTLGAEA